MKNIPMRTCVCVFKINKKKKHLSNSRDSHLPVACHKYNGINFFVLNLRFLFYNLFLFYFTTLKIIK